MAGIGEPGVPGGKIPDAGMTAQELVDRAFPPPKPFSSTVSDRALRIWAVEQAVKMGLHRDHVMIQAREFADYVREAKGKP